MFIGQGLQNTEIHHCFSQLSWQFSVFTNQYNRVNKNATILHQKPYCIFLLSLFSWFHFSNFPWFDLMILYLKVCVFVGSDKSHYPISRIQFQNPLRRFWLIFHTLCWWRKPKYYLHYVFTGLSSWLDFHRKLWEKLYQKWMEIKQVKQISNKSLT